MTFRKTFQEIHCLDKEKIKSIQSIIHMQGEKLIAELRQSPEERRARIEAHKNGYKEPYMNALKEAREKRKARFKSDK